MSQTLALFLDAYRDLNSRKMFWIVLILSTLVAASFAVLGLTPHGFEIFWWKFNNEIINSRQVKPADFYNLIFDEYGVGLWLAWMATILALISTASFFPDFIVAGAVDLYLSKPIGRLRLFLTKYCCGLLFVAMQIGCFCVASFLVIGLRGGVWEPRIFLAIPIVLLFFSYLFCVSVFIGVWTRSTIAAVLLTILFWGTVFIVHKGEVTMLAISLSQQNNAAHLDTRIVDSEKSVENAQKTAATRPTTSNKDHLLMVQAQLKSLHTERDDISDTFGTVHRILYATVTFLPKTSETIDLLDRALFDTNELQRLGGQDRSKSSDSSDESNESGETMKQIQADLLGRTLWWIIGTSIAFEGVVLAWAAWIFCRRDY